MDWKKLFYGSEEQSLSYFPPNTTDGSAVVEPPAKIFEEGISDWKLSLVRQFIGPPPNFSALQKLVEFLWGKTSKVRVSLAGSNTYVFSFANATIRSCPLFLRKWEPNLTKLNFDLDCMPIWIQMFNVPLELYSKKGLTYISSAIGIPLYMDSIKASKKSLEYAKVCVEVSACEKIPSTVDVKLRNGNMGIMIRTIMQNLVKIGTGTTEMDNTSPIYVVKIADISIVIPFAGVVVSGESTTVSIVVENNAETKAIGTVEDSDDKEFPTLQAFVLKKKK
ncbi:hypothetical protein V6N13_109903 [Hibiscus sabdariffa]